MWDIKPERCAVFQVEVMLVNATGVPTSVLTWSKLNDATTFPNGSRLQLVGVDLSDIGVYSCMPVNEVGSGPAANLSVNIIGESSLCEIVP